MVSPRCIFKLLITAMPLVSSMLLPPKPDHPSKTIAGASTRQSAVNAPPRSAPSLWKIEQTAASRQILIARQTAAATNVPTSTDLPVVFASTTITSLPKAICGFHPYNGTLLGSVYNKLTLEIIGCAGTRLITNTTIEFGKDDACLTRGEQLLCGAATVPQPPLSGCVQLSVTSFQNSWREYLGPLTYYHKPGEQVTYLTVSTPVTTTITDRGSIETFTRTTTYMANTRVHYETTDRGQLTCHEPQMQCQTLQAGVAKAYQCWNSNELGLVDSKTVSAYGLEDLKRSYSTQTFSFSTTMKGQITALSYYKAFPTETRPIPYSPTPVVPSDYFNALQKGFPSCGAAVNVTCNLLYDAAQNCWNKVPDSVPAPCYCKVLTNTNCAICESSPADRNFYYQWTMGLCATYFSQNPNTTWIERSRREDALWMDLQPFSWTVRSSDTTLSSNCPSISAKVASFAMINILVGLFVLFLGRRTVINKITCGVLGRAGSPWWPLVSIVVVVLNILANYINAVLLKSSPGFSSVPLGTLIVFWMSRPRMAWLSTALIKVEKEEAMYLSLGASALLSEFILQTIGAAYIGKTVVFAVGRDYLKKNRLRYAPARNPALLMYAGALLWVIAIGFFYLFVLYQYLGLKQVLFKVFTLAWTLLVLIWNKIKAIARFIRTKFRELKRSQNSPVGDPTPTYPATDSKRTEHIVTAEIRQPSRSIGYQEAVESMGLSPEVVSGISFVFCFMFLPFLGQWLFWVGFVQLSRDRYCPPPVWTMASVWTVFSSLGVLLGASV